MDTLDHIVINTLMGMDAAASIFADLGFQLTARGYHSLGSINHLAMVPGSYLELVGVPASGKQRQEVLESPLGLSGLVFKSADSDATYYRLTAAGFAPQPPLSFSRPVEIDGETVEAKFRTVRLTGAEFPAGRVYFCEHLTPQYVWRDEWLVHDNGFVSIDEIVVESTDLDADAARYAALCGTTASVDGEARVVALPGLAIRLVAGERPRFAGATLGFTSLDVLKARASASPEVAWSDDGPGRATLGIASLDLTLTARVAG
ncbi:VOC family protein [Acuticoccus sediminis]|uniref:VOC family protein n=1 Tax=Acuticoccus sediminis TaxID=2184697 RepID=A0A8B2NR03_9HYPH|nr:VOC family protein [Acuticoccus sediminis]RAH97429.1 VOC family protein [Acuticoccus sediminis]